MEQAPQPSPTPQAAQSKKRIVWGIILLAAPTILLIAGSLMPAAANFILATTGFTFDVTEGAPIGMIVVDTISYLFKSVGFLAWLPGVIVGIILLATNSHTPRQ